MEDHIIHHGEDEQLAKKAQNEKVKKNIAWISAAASFMIFAGLFSGVIVSMMDKYWVVMKLPKPFIISTIIIVLSSITLFLAQKMAQKGSGLVKALIGVTIILGLGFVLFQYKGWKKMSNKGYFIADNIFYVYGAYGSDFVMQLNGEEVYYDGYNYQIDGENLSEDQVNEMKQLAYEICGDNRRENDSPYQIDNYAKPFVIKRVSKDSIQGGLVEFKDGNASVNGVEFSPSQRKDLFRFAYGIYRNMPFFIISGKYGEDFQIALNGEFLEFENRKLYFPEKALTDQEIENINQTVYQGGQEYDIKDGEILLHGEKVTDPNLEIYVDLKGGIPLHYQDGKWVRLRQELNKPQYAEFYQTRNVASGFVWILTALHLLHILVGLILLLVIFFRSLKGYYNQNNVLGIKVTRIIWDFLAVVWLLVLIVLQWGPYILFS